MADIHRYRFERGEHCDQCQIMPSGGVGPWVKTADHLDVVAAKDAEITRLRVARAGLELQLRSLEHTREVEVRGLIAQRDGLRDRIKELIDGEGYGDDADVRALLRSLLNPEGEKS